MSEHSPYAGVVASGPQGALPRRERPLDSGAAIRVFPPSSMPSLVLCSRLSLISLKERRSWNGLPLSTKRSTWTAKSVRTPTPSS